MWDELKNEITNWLEVRRNRKLNRLREVGLRHIAASNWTESALAERIVRENKA